MFFKKRNVPHRRIDCLISADTTIDGNVAFSGGLRIDGTVKGSVVVGEGKSGTLVVSQQAKVEGQVTVTHAIINGEIQGNIVALEFLQLDAHARVAGDITYQILEMHHGAVVSGKLIHAIRTEPDAAPIQAS